MCQADEAVEVVDDDKAVEVEEAFMFLQTRSSSTWSSSNSWASSQTQSNAIKNNIKNIFNDINSSFAKADILLLYSKGIINWFSDGSFRPNNPATRAEFLAMTMKSFNVSLDDSIAQTSFSDVKISWMVKYVEKAKEYWIKGQILNWKSIFRPNDPITRAEALSVLLKIANIETPLVEKTSFRDVPDSSWIAKYVEKAKELWIISAQIKFRPNDPITRAETSKIITKTMWIK